MSANQNPSRRDDLLVMLLHGGAATNSIARSVVDHHAAEVRAEQAAEIDRLRKELEQTVKQRDYWHAELMHADARILELQRQIPTGGA